MPSANQFFNILNALTQPDLANQINFLKTENAILRKYIPNKHLFLTDCEKNRLLKFGLPLGGQVKRLISIVHYSAFRRWVQNLNSPNIKPDSRRGRPRKMTESIARLIIHMAKYNKWGYTKILGELKKLNIPCLSKTTIKNTLKAHGIDPLKIRSTDTWNAFLNRHFETLWACDFFSQYVWTPFGRRLYYVLFFININTRKVSIAGITKHPNEQWVLEHIQKLSKVFDKTPGKSVLIRDRDCKFARSFDKFFENKNFSIIKTPYRSPNMNPYAESWVATIKRECLSHFCILGETHLSHLVTKFLEYYNHQRPHSHVNNEPLDPGLRHSRTTIIMDGEIHARPILGGLMHHYYRT